MKKILGSVAAAVALAAGAAHAADMSAPQPYHVKNLVCDRVVLTWMTSDRQAVGPASVVTVENKQGTTGLRYYVDRSRGIITAVEAWEAIAGNETSTTLPGTPRIDYQNCRQADSLGGIVIEYFDAKDWQP